MSISVGLSKCSLCTLKLAFKGLKLKNMIMGLSTVQNSIRRQNFALSPAIHREAAKGRDCVWESVLVHKYACGITP